MKRDPCSRTALLRRRPARRARCEMSARRTYRAHSRLVEAAVKDKSAPFGVAQVGVDTISYAWRPTNDEVLWDRLQNAAKARSIAGLWRVSPAGVPGGWMLSKPLACARWFFFPESRLIFAEGRLGAMVSGREGDFSLGRFSSLPGAAMKLEKEVAQALGHDPDEGIGGDEIALRRLDLAAELRWSDPADGLAALQALGTLSIPRVKVCEWRHEGRTETVSYYTATKRRKLLMRIYDKGVQTRSEAPGTLLRFERQHRWVRADQPEVFNFSCHADPAALWLDRFEDWAESAERLAVKGGEGSQLKLIEAVEDGSLDREKAERLIGALGIARLRGESWWADLGKPHLGQRRRRDLDALGVPLAYADEPVRTVALGAAIKSLRDAWGEPLAKRAEPTRADGRPKRNGGERKAVALPWSEAA